MSVDIAVNKAYTSASFQVPTTELQAQSGQSWFQSMIVSTQGKIMAVGGCLPVLDSPNIVGAVGVSGGTAEQDQECARAALAAYSIAFASMPKLRPWVISRLVQSSKLCFGLQVELKSHQSSLVIDD